MRNTFGTLVSVTLFGESRGELIGAVLDGMAPGVAVDEAEIERMLTLRRPWGDLSTARREPDRLIFAGGVWNGRTTGAPLALLILNEDARDDGRALSLPRPGHADYTQSVRYGGFADLRGGGHLSGRLTAPLVAVGAVALSALRQKGVLVGTHLARCGGVADRPFSDDPAAEIEALRGMRFAALDGEAGRRMQDAIRAAAAAGDSVGGVLETAVTGLPAGVGEPWFDTLEGLLAHAFFSIPGVKGVEFGGGFAMADATGSEWNDAFYCENGTVRTRTNRNGGVNGGISNGMPLLLRALVKPTPSIARAQETVDLRSGEAAELRLGGRNDPAIIHRARAVADALTALTLCDALAQRFGTDWLGGA